MLFLGATMSNQQQKVEVENSNHDPTIVKSAAVMAVEQKLEKIYLTSINLAETETDLSKELKSLCDENGKEINPPASALLLHKLGEIYKKRSPNMFSLIRSAVLYNAALLRNPPNKQVVEKDLQNLCWHILSLARAADQTVQLTHQAEIVKQEVLEMRKEGAQSLNEIKTIPENVRGVKLHFLEKRKTVSIKNLQYRITERYTKIMKNLAQFCEKVMGEAPCRFALAGMGSLARREITPFSDFENIILLDNTVCNDESHEKKLNYFRWFSVIFHIVLINIQETIVPSVAIDSLSRGFFDDITPRGISFDGMMPYACKFPLGRQEFTEKKPWETELIKPVEEMLKYMSTEANLKNGYHLSDILTKTCFVYKDKHIFEEFEIGVCDITEKEFESVLEDVKKQVIKDLDSFATKFSLSNLKPDKQFNVKRIVYRSTTLFISALGRICNISASSCFDIIAELYKKNAISDYAKHKLMTAVAVACEIRLRWYIKSNKQCDNIDSAQVLVDLVGKKTIISYFQTAYALQYDISKRLNLKPNYFYSTPLLMNVSLATCFGGLQQLNFLSDAHEQAYPSKKLQDFDNCLKFLESQTIQNTNETVSTLTIYETSKRLNELGKHLSCNEVFDEAIECYQKSNELIQQIHFASTKQHCVNDEFKINLQKQVSKNYRDIGLSLNHLNKTKDAETNFNKSVIILQALPSEKNDSREFVLILATVNKVTA